MANEFIIRKGYKSLASSEVTGSLTLIGNYESIRALTINSTKGSGTEHYFRTHGVNGDTLAIYSGGNRVLSIDSNSIDVLGSISGSTYYGDGSNLTGISIDGGNATTLDSLDSTQFLRSDAADTATGAITFTSDIQHGSFGNNNSEFALGQTVANKVYNYGAEIQTQNSSIQLVLGRNNGTSVQGTGGIGADQNNAFAVWNTTSTTQIFEVEHDGDIQAAGGATFAGTVTAATSFIADAVSTSNNDPGTDNVQVSGYGLIGNRGTVYLTNVNSAGSVQIGVGGVHNNSPQLVINTTNSTFYTNAIPQADSTYNLGSSTLRWNVGYFDSLRITNVVTNKILKFDGTDIDDSIMSDDGTTVSVAGDMTVTGTLTAQEFHTEFVSASIIYESGSTKFGDTSDDVHDFTGSVNVKSLSTGAKLTIEDDTAKTELQHNLHAFRIKVDPDNADSNSNLRVEIDGSEKLRIDTGGDVGIGTTTPTGKFNSYISATRQLTHNGNGGDLSIISDNNSSPVFNVKGTGTADLVNVFDNTTEVFTIKDGGNVGIGATDPLRDLHVVGNMAVNAATTEYYGILMQGGEGADPSILIGDWHNSSASIKWDSSGNYLRIDSQHSTANAAILFSGNDGTTEYMRIASTGNVGIGTSSPLVKLDINGVLYSRGGTWNGGGSESDYTVVGAVIQEGHFIFTKDGDNLRKLIGKTSDIIEIGQAGTALIDGISFLSGTNPLYKWYSNTSEIMRLNGDGLIIGTTSAEGKLTVRSDSTSTQFSTMRNNEGGFLNRTYADYSNDGAIVEYQERVGVDGNYTRIGNFSNHPLYLMNNNDTKVTILTDGTVGIGTTSPDYTLDIDGNIGINDYMYHNGDGNTRIGFSGNDSFIVRTAGTDRITVSSNGNAQFNNSVLGTLNNSSNGLSTLAGFIVEQGAENGSKNFILPGAVENAYAGASDRYTVTSTKNGSSINLGANMFKSTNNYSSTAVSTNDTVVIIISGRSFTHSSGAGIAFSSGAWRAKDIEIETSTDGTNYTSRGSVTDYAASAFFVTFSTGGTATTHIKYTLTNFNSTSTRISHVFANNYSGGDPYFIDKYYEDTKYNKLNIDTSGGTDNYYLQFLENGTQRLTFYENSNNVYINGGGGSTHFRPRLHGGTGNFLVSGANVGFDVASPSEKLEVSGNVSASAYYGDGSNLTGISIDGGNATTLDNLDSTQFLRSDESDTFTGALTLTHSTFGQALILNRNHAANAASLTFKNTSGQAGILYATYADTTLRWRDGTTTNAYKIWHEGNDGPTSGLAAQTAATASYVAASNIDGSVNADTLDSINSTQFLRSDAADTASELITFQKGISQDGNAKFYTWRALDNTSNTSNQYFRIARITSTQSSRFAIEIAGRSTSYSSPYIPAIGVIVGQLNNDNNYDIVFYNHKTGTSQVVTEVGQVDVSTTATDIYIKVGQYAEISATGHISDGSITTYGGDSASSTAPTNYVAATEVTVWNSGNDGPTSGLAAQTAATASYVLGSNVDGSVATATTASNAMLLDGFDSTAFPRKAEDATVSGHYNFTGTSTKLPSHFYTNRYDSAGNVYFHVGTADNVANILNLRVYDASNSVKTLVLNGATGAISWNGSTIWHAGNDGPTSGLAAQTAATASYYVETDTLATVTGRGSETTTSVRFKNDLNYFGLATTNNEAEIIINTGNDGSPQIGFTEHGDASWAIGIDDGDNSFKIHGTASATIPTLNNLASPLFEITTDGTLAASGRITGGEHGIFTSNVYAGGAQGFVFGGSTSEGEYIQRSGNDIRFIAGGSTRMTIDGDDTRVGIGTTTTSAVLQLYKAHGTAEFVTLSNSTSAGKIQIGFQQNDTDGMHHRALISSEKDSNGTYGGRLDFKVREHSTANYETALTLRSDQSVGIGTTDPTARLTVEGSGSTVFDVQGSQGQLFSITDDLTGDLFSVSDISGIPILNVNASGDSYFDGNLGIGTSVPTYPLDVNGEVRFRDGNIRGNNSFDFLSTGGSAQQARFKSIQVSTSYSGTPPDNGILFSTDTNLYRSAANVLKTDDSFEVDGRLYADAALTVTQAAADQNTGQDSGTIPSTGIAEMIRFQGNYTNGSYTTELVKVDRSGNLPLYFRQSKGTANSFTNLIRIGDHGQTNGTDIFAVFGSARVDGTLTAANVTATSVLYADEIRDRTGQDLTITAGEASSHLSQGTHNDEIIRMAAEGGIRVFASSDNLGSGLNRQSILIDSNGNSVFGDQTALTRGGTARVSSKYTSTSGVALSMGLSDNNMSYVRQNGNGVFQWQTYNSGNSGQLHFQPYGGNVGIGSSSPSAKLDVNGDLKVANGSIGINVTPSTTDGRLDASNDVVAYSTSDRRLKENIIPISDPLNKINKINGVEFDWIPLTDREKRVIHGNEGHDVGVIAQEIEDILPVAVKQREHSKYKAVRYEKIIPLLIEGIKEQQNQIDQLQAIVNKLQNEK